MNIKSISKLLFAGGGLLLLAVACNKGVNDKIITPPAYSEFGTSNLLGRYFITNSASSSFKIPVGITNVSNTDRTIQFTLTSPTGAVAGTQYTAPTSIVIPAGEALDSLEIKGLFAGYPAGRRDTLRIKITGGDVPVNAYNNTYNLVMQKYCDVTLSALYGNYTRAFDNGTYGPYPMTVVTGSAVSTGATTGTLKVTNVWDPGVPVTTTINLDWTNPSGFTVTIPDQVYFAPADLWIKGTTAGTFSSCDQTFTLRYTLYEKSTGVNYSANQVTTMAR